MSNELQRVRQAFVSARTPSAARAEVAWAKLAEQVAAGAPSSKRLAQFDPPGLSATRTAPPNREKFARR